MDKVITIGPTPTSSGEALKKEKKSCCFFDLPTHIFLKGDLQHKYFNSSLDGDKC